MEREKNKLNNVGWLMLLILAALLLLHFLPKIYIGERALRQVDILSDVFPKPAIEEPDSLALDSLLPPPPKPAFVDTCKTGITCIEDYGDSTLRGMVPFYKALAEMKEQPRPVRIAYFGDSFIEGDIMTVDLRQMFQEAYGGHGVGYVSISSAISGYRNSVRHRATGWSSHALTDSVYFNRRFQDISNHYFFAREGAQVELTGVKQYARLDTCQQSTIFFLSKDSMQVSAYVNGGKVKSQALDSIGRLSALTVEGKIGRVRWNVEQADSSLFYGVTMDDTIGVALDNFSLRGSSGLNIRSVPHRRQPPPQPGPQPDRPAARHSLHDAAQPLPHLRPRLDGGFHAGDAPVVDLPVLPRLSAAALDSRRMAPLPAHRQRRLHHGPAVRLVGLHPADAPAAGADRHPPPLRRLGRGRALAACRRNGGRFLRLLLP